MKVLKKSNISPYVDVCQQGCNMLVCYGLASNCKKYVPGGGCTLGGGYGAGCGA